MIRCFSTKSINTCVTMGNIFTLFKSFFAKRTIKILMVGMPESGRTTILYQLKLRKVVSTIHTTGCNIEVLEYKSLRFVLWDMGGSDKFWPIYRHYFPNKEYSQDLIFVVDSSDREQIDRAKYELTNLWENSLVREDAALLVYANKQDLPDAMNEAEIIEKLGLRSFRNGKWHVQEASALTGNGLFEGLEWLFNQLKNVER